MMFCKWTDFLPYKLPSIITSKLLKGINGWLNEASGRTINGKDYKWEINYKWESNYKWERLHSRNNSTSFISVITICYVFQCSYYKQSKWKERLLWSQYDMTILYLQRPAGVERNSSWVSRRGEKYIESEDVRKNLLLLEHSYKRRLTLSSVSEHSSEHIVLEDSFLVWAFELLHYSLTWLMHHHNTVTPNSQCWATIDSFLMWYNQQGI